MIVDGKVVGLPIVEYVGTKATIQAITSGSAGMVAYATDTQELGAYGTGGWKWMATSGSTAIAELTAGAILVGGSPNYLEVAAGGELTLHGDATTWDDSMIPATAFRTGGTGLTFAAFDGGIWLHRFDIGDIFYIQVQMPHAMKLNTIIYPHLHLAVNAAIGATNYNVEVSTEHAWANIGSAFESAPVVTSTGLVVSFQNAAQYTHKVLSLAAITPTAAQGGISSYVIFKIERIAAVTQALSPATSLFILGADIHYQIDSFGSRTEFSK